MATFKLIYKDFSVTHPVGDLPQLKLRFDFIGMVDNSWGVYIPNLLWLVSLGSTETPESHGMSALGDWGEFESITHVKFTSKIKKVDVFCTIPMSSPKIMQLIDIRAQNIMPRLEINVKVNYLEFIKVRDIRQLSSISSMFVKANMHFRGKVVDNITFNTDEIIKLLEELRQYELLRIEIPVKKEGTPINKRLADVVKILDTSNKDLLDGNYDGVLKGTRHAIEKIIKKDENDPNKKKWILYEDIVNCYNHNVPITAKEEYKILLNQIKSQFHSQLCIINNVYMHKDKKKVHPRPEDAEQILFITAFLVRYLSQSCIND